MRKVDGKAFLNLINLVNYIGNTLFLLHSVSIKSI